MPARLPGPDRVLLVEDNVGDAALVQEYLRTPVDGHPTIDVASTLAEAQDLLSRGDRYDAILLDLVLPDSRGLEALDLTLDVARDTPVLVLTGLSEEKVGIDAVRRGAEDFLPKDELSALVLGRAIRYAIERKRTSERLRRSRDQFRAIVTAGPYAVLVVDAEGHMRQTNPQTEILFGYSRTELVGQKVELLLPEDLREAHEAHRARYTENPRMRPMGAEVALRGRRKDGSIFPLEIQLSSFEERGELNVLAVMRDVSSRTERQEKIAFQARLLDAVGQAVVETDLDGVIRYWNRAAEELYGWTELEAIGRHMTDLVPTDLDRQVGDEIMKALREGDSWTGEFVIHHKEGSSFPAIVTTSPVTSHEGRLLGIISIASDITERARAEDELARTNRALRVVSAANEAVLRSSSEEEILNEACRIAVEEGGYEFAWIGYAEDDPERTVRPVAARGGGMIDREPLEVSWADGPRGQGPAGTAIRTRRPHIAADVEVDPVLAPWRDELLERGWRSVASLPLVDRDTCLGAMSIFSSEADAFDAGEVEILSDLGADLAHGVLVHRARQRDAEMQNRLRDAEKLRAVGQLAGGLAHDFKNYLTVITTLTDLLLADSELREDHVEDLEEIRLAADHSALLIRQLLTFSRRDAHDPKVVDPNQIVGETMKLLDRLLGESIEVRRELGRDVTPVLIDPGQLEQVVMNLAINARDAMPDGGTLTIRTAMVDGQVLLEVADTGIGMDDETRSRIFEPFYTTKSEGTGLGLATVHGIVLQSRGAIFVKSRPGEGTSLQIHLPGADSEAEPEDDRDPALGEELTGSETLLLVEEQAPLRFAARRILERQGYRVLDVETLDAAARLAQGRPDEIHLLLIDPVSVQNGGAAAMARLRAERPNLQVLFTTDDSLSELEGIFIYDSRSSYIQKPYDSESLARIVRLTLDGGTAAGALD